MKIKIPMSSVYNEYTDIIDNTTTSTGLRSIIKEIYQKYSFGNFNIIGEYSTRQECVDYLNYKCKDLIYKYEPSIISMYSSSVSIISTLLEEYAGDSEEYHSTKRHTASDEYTKNDNYTFGKSTSTLNGGSIKFSNEGKDSSYKQNENSPFNADIKSINSPVFKEETQNSNEGKATQTIATNDTVTNSGEDNKSISHRGNDQYEDKGEYRKKYVKIDDLIKKYDLLTQKDYSSLSNFVDKFLVKPLVDEFNTVY